MSKRIPLATRFLAKCSPEPTTGCWLWTGLTDKDGYGRIVKPGKINARAHRVSYELHVGEIPSGMLVCHRCDVPACVNPAHLFLGTNRENLGDMAAKGRQWPFGIHHPLAKLTNERVSEIRTAHASGESQRSLARRYGLARPTIRNVVERTTWKHVAVATY